VRPNIHIDDIIGVYNHFIMNPNIPSGSYNAGFENISITDLANMVAKETGASIETSESNDPRSYRQDSSKLLATSFTPQKNVRTAIVEIIEAYRSGAVTDKDEWHTVRWMSKLGLGI
jgi:nucleoside-diphosphate-sugar epimerase